VFCYNELAQHNIFVDPETFNSTAINDWEFVGYFSKEFEYPFWRHPYNRQIKDDLDTDSLIGFLDW
jgi:hypothetical protein